MAVPFLFVAGDSPSFGSGALPEPQSSASCAPPFTLSFPAPRTLELSQAAIIAITFFKLARAPSLC
jgi:hypothetical protein